MLSFDASSKTSIPIAVIHNKKKDNIIYLNLDDHGNLSKNLKHVDSSYSDKEEEEELKGLKSITLDRLNQRISLIPNTLGGDRYFISGPTGCGKSTIIGDYIKSFVKLFKDKDIFL